MSKNLTLVAGALAIAALSFVIGTSFGGAGSDHTHPEVVENSESWTCSMHPQVKMSEPGACPICGMDLVPATPRQPDQSAPTSHPHRVTLSERSHALAQIRTAPVRRMKEMGRELRLLGRVEYDETQVRMVTSWVAGRIDRLHVASTGASIRRGQTMATVYSPEVYAAQQDLLAAATAARQLGGSAERTLNAARQRLKLLGIPADAVARMEQAKEPSERIRIYSQFSGTVIDRLVDEGSFVDAGAPIYRVADLSRVWLQLDAYASDLANVAVGLRVSLSTSAFPGREFEGRVAFIDPVVDPRTRTARVRVEVSNREGLLRPGMFAEATVETKTRGDDHGHEDDHQPLVIPDTAPLFSGRRSLVYVEHKSTNHISYESREVRLAQRTGEVYPVMSGLLEGERVVVHGAFVIDADLQLRGGRSLMSLPDDREAGSLHESTLVPLRPVMEQYLKVHQALAADSLDDAQGSAKAMAKLLESVPALFGDTTGQWPPLAAKLSSAAKAISQAESIDAARRQFEFLSQSTIALLEQLGNPLRNPVRLAWCPMAIDGRSAFWVQQGDTVTNPYHGSSMLTCGTVHQTASGGEVLDSGTFPAGGGPSHGGGHE